MQSSSNPQFSEVFVKLLANTNRMQERLMEEMDKKVAILTMQNEFLRKENLELKLKRSRDDDHSVSSLSRGGRPPSPGAKRSRGSPIIDVSILNAGYDEVERVYRDVWQRVGELDKAEVDRLKELSRRQLARWNLEATRAENMAVLFAEHVLRVLLK